MIYVAILTASLFLLTAFAVERFDRASGLSSVVVMIALGMIAKPALRSMGMLVGGLEAVVPVAGAVGLVLIVLEGALDIELRREHLRLAATAFAFAFGALIFYGAVFAAVAAPALRLSLLQAAMLAIPFSLISSAIAIPASRLLATRAREFIVYESSASDILGVLVFFALLNSGASVKGFLTALAGGGLLSLLIAAACSIVLVFVSTRATAHVRFVPLLAGLFALYSAGELLHLSPLIMVLLFGLMLNNRAALERVPPLSPLAARISTATVEEFKVLVQELTFAVRGEGGRLVGSFTSTYETSPWIHPSSYTGIPRGPLGGICAGSFDNVFPPGEYTITFFGGPGTVRIAQAIEVLPARAPEGASQYGTFANGMACPRALNR